MISLHHEIFGRQYGELFKTPFGTCNRYRFFISTRTGNLKVKMPDGEIVNYNTPKLVDSTISKVNGFERNYPTPYSPQDIEVTSIKGNSDIYSIYFGWANKQYNDNYNIQDIGTFFSQFPNLYSINWDIYAYKKDAQRPTIKGNLFALPKSVTRVTVNKLDVLDRPNNIYGNFDSFTNDMQLTYFSDVDYWVSGGSKYYGNLAKTPPSVNFLKITATNNSILTYTSGKVWASSFDTLDIGNATMSYSDIDNLLNDMANSIATAIGSKVIRLAYCYRTVASDTAVAYLQSLGFTITILGILLNPMKILDLPLQNNFTDTTGINTMVAGGTSNLPTFTLEGGEYAATFNGSQSLKTNSNFVINSDKVSISFWLKTSQTTRATLGNGSSIDLSLNTWVDTLGIYTSGNAGGNAVTTQRNFVNWTHIVMIYDRNLGKDQGKIYVNGVLNFSQRTDNYANNIGNFVASIFILGQSASLTQGFNGQLKFLKIFNYPLTQTEITNLYNKTM